jgi:hypothetical protein
MTSEKERIRKAIFGKLRTVRRKLNAQGVPCTYSRSVLSHESGGNGFTITCTNGDAIPLTTISIRTGEGVEDFDAAQFEQGLARVRQLFQNQGGTGQ